MPNLLRRDSSLARAVEGGGRGRVGVEVFDDARRRSGLGVDGAPRAGDGGGAFDVVTAAGDAGEAEADTGGNQVDGNRNWLMHWNKRKLTDKSRYANALRCGG